MVKFTDSDLISLLSVHNCINNLSLSRQWQDKLFVLCSNQFAKPRKGSSRRHPNLASPCLLLNVSILHIFRKFMCQPFEPSSQESSSLSQRSFGICSVFLWNLHLVLGRGWGGKGKQVWDQRSRRPSQGRNVCWLSRGRGKGKAGDLQVYWEGKRRCFLPSPQRCQGAAVCCGAFWLCSLEFPAFLSSWFYFSFYWELNSRPVLSCIPGSLSVVNFTCQVFTLIFIPSFFFPYARETYFLHVSLGDFPGVFVSHSDWGGRVGQGFHKLVIQPEFCVNFMFSILYFYWSIWKSVFCCFGFLGPKFNKPV